MKKAKKGTAGPIGIEHIYLALDDVENTLEAIRAALQSGRVAVPPRPVKKSRRSGKRPLKIALTVSRSSLCPVARTDCYPDTLKGVQEAPRR